MRRRGARLLGAGLALLAARSWGLPLPLWSCPLRHLSGVPCPTCFLTRSAMASFRGDLVGALELHAFGPPLLLAGLWFTWEQGVRRSRPLPARTLALALAASGVALLLYWLVRLWLWGRSGLLAVWMADAPLGRWWLERLGGGFS